ncbi:MAG: hypothetical protein ACJ788_20580 [Ktedonobacteraceae bacterium]
MAEDVNEAGADHHPRRVNYLARRLYRNTIRRRNLQHAISTDGYIPIEPRVASAINDLRTTDQNINLAYRHAFTPHYCVSQL